jgi:hypothetical protein
MPTYAPNFANRYLVKYRAVGKEHTMSFRYGLTPSPPPTDLVTGVGNFLVALAPQLTTDFAVLSASFVEAGTSFNVPATAPLYAGGSATPGIGDAPRFYSFTGRTLAAQPAIIYVYGAAQDPGDNSMPNAGDYRLLASNAITELSAITELTGADGIAVLWNQYANVAYNAYYQRKARRG